VANRKIVVAGAGMGGLMAALILSGRGYDVRVLERAATPGGKMRLLFADGRPIDAGPTVFTLKRVFEEAFASVGLDFDACAPAQKAQVLARHGWDDAARLDLHADLARAIESVRAFAGDAEAAGFARFSADSARVWRSLERSFARAPAPDFLGLVKGAGFAGLPDLLAVSPFTTLWRGLGGYFRDPRLRQLFGRYATYVGSSPFLAPATLMLVAHVEQDGVWMIEGGMHRLAQVLAERAQAFGARFCYGAHVEEIARAGAGFSLRLADGERIPADAVIFNGDANALAQGLLGPDCGAAAPAATPDRRSLSAVTWTFASRTRGFPLVRHNVFFSRDYKAEFDALAQGRMIEEPTVYVCAQDRGDEDRPRAGAERLLALVNAPAIGERGALSPQDAAACGRHMTERLAACGLTLDDPPSLAAMTDPSGFHALFPATGGALYGRASHGWRASFQRPGVRTRVKGLYLAGGSAHPGAGVPMAALSGWAAATCVSADLTSR
jgi:1-hydroxycarotenoid 3,4-desaturase